MNSLLANLKQTSETEDTLATLCCRSEDAFIFQSVTAEGRCANSNSLFNALEIPFLSLSARALSNSKSLLQGKG